MLTTDRVNYPYKILQEQNLAETIPEEPVCYLKSFNEVNFQEKQKLLLPSLSQTS